jgi:hypothetical protein
MNWILMIDLQMQLHKLSQKETRDSTHLQLALDGDK